MLKWDIYVSMALFNFTIPEALIKALSENLSKVEKIAPKMLEESAPIVVNALKNKAPVSTGKMRDGIKAQKPSKTKNGAHILSIAFTGSETRKSKDGKATKIPNAIKAAVTEYGKSDQEAQPFIRPAVAETEKEVIEKMPKAYS